MHEARTSGLETLTDCLELWAAELPEKRLYAFLDVEGRERESYTYRSFLDRTMELAAYLAQAGLGNGDRVLLVYPPGLEIVAAFYACARIGVIAVPVYPPSPMSFEAGLAKLTFIARDCQARAALTTRGFYRSYQLLLAKRRISSLFTATPALPELEWLTTDDTRGGGPSHVPHDPNPILFLQYTSGSTADPKGVVVSHRNVIANCHGTLQHVPNAVSWLPQYHDMGLIGYYLYPLIMGGSTHGFSPLDFLKRPALWMEVMTRVGATVTSAPNFAYDYCLRQDKLPDEALRGIDLRSLLWMMNAAEPVRADTMRRFRERFERYGLRPEAAMVAFGLAENTLAVSMYGKQSLAVNKHLLQQRTLHIEKAQPANNNQARVVSCGSPLQGVEVRIVDPEFRIGLGEGRIGEIWLGGASKCSGYWNRPELSREVFQATLAGEDGGPTYLRTGDLGFLHEGELYVCGRIKDLIIIRGVNYYPQDIETIVEAASPEVRTGCVAAFSADLDGEALIVVAEVKDEHRLPDAASIARAIRTQYYIEPHTIAFVRRRSIPKTSSGKLARSKVRDAWSRGQVAVLASHVRAHESGPELTGLRDRFRYIVELYNLTGREEYTFAEIGIDSLTMVTLLDDIKGLLDEHGLGELVDDVDVRLLQKLTIAQFFGLLDHLDQGPQEPLPALRNLLHVLHEEHEAHERESMRTDSQLPATGISEGHPQAAPVTNVLFTGATGFFGPFLLASLLKRTSHTFHVLIRATDPVHGRDRIRAALRRARLWTPALDAELDKRVHMVCGDLGRERLGLPVREWETLAEQVQAICHNGAMVNYVLSYDALKPYNVDGTRELLRLAFIGPKKEFHLISSTFIFGWSTKQVLWETDSNEEMAHLDFGYAQTKWVAEQLVLAAQKKGLDARVYRPSLISASTGGAVGSRDDIAIRLIAFMVRYGMAVDAPNQISFLPVDLVADNIAAIFDLPRGAENTLHVTADEYYNFGDVTRTMTRLYGYQFEYHDLRPFVAKMIQYAAKDDPVYPLLDFFNRFQDKLDAMKHKRYSNERYREARQASNGAGDPPLDQIVTCIVEFMLREGVIDPRSPQNRLVRPALPEAAAGLGTASV